eukprot:5941537-Prymnesium_polylepis.1
MYADAASRIVRQHPSTRPLYLYLAFQSVHGPLQVPERYERLHTTAHPEWDRGRRIYAGMVTAMDSAIGRVLQALRGAKLWDSSLVVFMADNGGVLGMMDNWPLRGGKFGLWEGGVRIVGLLGGPVMHAQRGAAWSGLAHTADLLPTLLDAASVSVPSYTGPTPLDGVSLWRALRSNGSSPRTEVIHQIVNRYNPRDCMGADHDAQNCGGAIRVGKHKLLWGYPGDARGHGARGGQELDWVRFPNNATE